MNELDQTTWEELMQLASLTSDPDALSEGLDPLTLEDPERLADLLRRLALDDRFEHELRRHLMDHEGGTLRHQLSQRTLSSLAAREITARGGSESGLDAAQTGGDGGGGGGGGGGLGTGISALDAGGAGSSSGSTTPQEPVQQSNEPKIRAWKVQCEHSPDGRARTIEDRTSFQVVPDANDNDDKVVVLYRDDYDPPPPTLPVRVSDGSNQDIPQGGAGGGGGGYVPYQLTASFLGDRSKVNILSSDYWAAYNASTTYTVDLPPTDITVRAHYPHKWKLEFAFPPMRSFKAGSKLERGITRDGAKPALKKTEESWDIEETGWAPSSLTITKKSETSADGVKAPEASRSAGPIKLSKDNAEVSIDVLAMVGDILKLADTTFNIIKAIQDNAPKIGWYCEANFQLMQGGLAFEWGWKEHDDHRAYKWINVAIEMTIFSASLEIGVGISGLGFKAQVYAALEGSLKIKTNGERTSPDGQASVTLGPAVAAITGKVGARFEAGNFFKANGEGSTGIELSVEVKINYGNTAVRLAGDAKWTGLKVEATVSGGLFSIGGTKKWSKELISPRSLGSFSWPKATPYNPPYISRSALKTVITNSISSGWDVRVIKSVSGLFNDEHWSVDRIATALVDKIDPRTDIRRDADSMEGLAHKIRQRLNEMGSRWGRDYVEESDFLSFVNGELPTIMNDYIDPPRLLAQSMGATP